MNNNGQSAVLNLSNEQLQVLISGKLGDGCFQKHPTCIDYNFITNCIHKEYIDYKTNLLGNLVSSTGSQINQGYKNNIIYRLRTHSNPFITEIAEETLEDSLSKLDELGLAMWFYDDGSLHKSKYFYNLNTQSFSEEINKDLFIPFLKSKFEIKAKATIERKKDGREFWYLRIGKWDGSAIIAETLNKFYVNCYNYKIWDSETIQKWSKLQEQLKSTHTDINKLSSKMITAMLNKISV